MSTREGAPGWVQALSVIGAFVVALWVIELIDTLLNHRLDHEGIEPREADGLLGILFAPLLHGGWGHLAANTLPALVLGFLVLLSGVGTWAAVTLVVWVVGGFGTWLTGGDGTVHLGASGLIFGWLVYLLVRGLFTRNVGQLALGVVVLLVYGSVLWGVVPGQEGISWQGHLFGAVGGGIAAWFLAERGRPVDAQRV